MTLQPKEPNRKVIPRWRQLDRTATHELISFPSQGGKTIDGESEIREKLELWRETKSLSDAIEVVTAAIVLGHHSAARSAANLILDSGTPYQVLRDVATLVAKSMVQDSEPFQDTLDNQIESLQPQLALLRRRWHEFPRNALFLVEASRLYLINSQAEQAVRSMEIALKLEPESRFVLRSAARLFVNQEHFDRAHDIVRKAEAVKFDPWLLAPEMALSALAGRTSNYVKVGINILANEGLPRIQFSELASALGTIELESGAIKKARRLFEYSIATPTDNSLAQVEWAQSFDKRLKVKKKEFSKQVPNSAEAKALNARRRQDWGEVTKNCIDWFRDEPFSNRPMGLASYVAAALMDDYALSEHLCRRGLRTNPGNYGLRNNLVVALANQSKTQDSITEFEKVVKPNESDDSFPSYLATKGLLEFRKGNFDAGRNLYDSAIIVAEGQKRKDVASLADVFKLREELKLKPNEDVKRELVKKCEGRVKSVGNKEVLRALNLTLLSQGNFLERVLLGRSLVN